MQIAIGTQIRVLLALVICLAQVLAGSTAVGGTDLDTVRSPEIPLDDGLPDVGAEDYFALALGTPAGEVVLLTVEDRRLRAARSVDGGATFGPETVVAGGSGQGEVSVVDADLSSGGTVYVALVVLRPGGEYGLQFVAGDSLGTTWSIPTDLVLGSVTVDEVQPLQLMLDVAAGPSDRVAIGFHKGGVSEVDTASHPHVITSSNGGASWTTPVRLDSTAGVNESGTSNRALDVGIDAAGVIHAAFDVAPSGGQRVAWYSRSTDSGVSFEAERDFLGILPAGETSRAVSPTLEITGDGSIVVAFWDQFGGGRLYAVHSDDGGSTFGLSYAYATSSQIPFFSPPEVHASSEGIVLLAGGTQDGSLVVHRSTDHGASFGSPQQLATAVRDSRTTGRLGSVGLAGPPARLAQTPGGNWVLAWDDLRTDTYAWLSDVYVSVSTDDGVTWQPEQRADGDAAGAAESIVASIVPLDSDDALIVFRDGRDDNGRSFNAWANRLTVMPFAFAGDQRIDQDEGVFHVDTGLDLAIATDGASRVYVAFASYAAGPLMDIYVAVSTDGGYSFAPPIRVGTDAAGDQFSVQPKIAATADGHVYVVHESDDRAAGERRILFNHSADFGATWLSTDVVLGAIPGFPPSDDFSFGYPDITAESGGKVYIAWSDETSVFVSRSLNSGTSFVTEDLDEDPLDGSFYPRICSLGDRLVLVFQGLDSSFGYAIWARVSTDAGANWSSRSALHVTGQSAADFLTPPDLACGDTDKAVAVWQDQRDRQVHSAHFDGSTWQSDLVVSGPSWESFPNAPQVTFAGSQDVVLVYSGDGIQAARSADAGGSFGAAVRLNDASPDPAALVRWPHITADDQGNVWANWLDYSNGLSSFAVRHSADGGQTWGGVKRMDTSSPQGTRSNLYWIFATIPSATLPGTGLFTWPGQRDSFRRRPLLNAWDLDDLDRDGAASGIDCDDQDFSAQSVPGTVDAVMVEQLLSDTTELTWSSLSDTAGAGTVYDLVSGLLSDLKGSGGFGGAECLALGRAAPSFLDVRGGPATGDADYYLVRGRNNCGAGGYGGATLLPDPRADLGSGPCP